MFSCGKIVHPGFQGVEILVARDCTQLLEELSGTANVKKSNDLFFSAGKRVFRTKSRGSIGAIATTTNTQLAISIYPAQLAIGRRT